MRYILDRYGSFLQLVAAEPRVGGEGLVGSCDDQQWLTQEEASLVQRFDPSGDQDTIGFFIAKFIRKQI